MSAAAELKRVSFMTIDSSTDFLKKPEKEAVATAGGNKSKTIRLELEIYEPDARRNSDFNYKKLIHIEKKKQKKLSKLPNGVNSAPDKSNASDPFGDDEDDIARIAREMEAKYGTGSSYGGGGGGKSSGHDYDRGIGYDDNDSFIDNTEAYDEIIPEDIDTVRGGFYVNSGLLEFKKIPNFERPGDEIRMPKAKKRALSTTSESSDGEDKPDQESTSGKSKKKKKHIDKKAKSATSSSDEQGKAAKKAKKEKPEKQKMQTTAAAAVQSPVVKESEKKKESVVDDSKKIIKTTTVKDMLRAKRDNLRKMEQGKSSGGTTTTTDNDEDDGSESVGSSLAVSESSRDSHHQGEVNGGTTAATATVVKDLSLPNTFSSELVQMITTLKQQADTNMKNTQTFFDNHIKDQLLQIDTIAKSQSQQVRLQVYQQLETFLPISKKAILIKINRFRIQQAENKIKNEIQKLKGIVNEAMPDLVRKFDEDQKVYDNVKEVNNIVGGEPVEVKSPRKKYHWNESSRQILSDTMLYIQELFKILKVKKETSEEYSMRYLKEHLLPVWPEGWIKLEDFQKELEKKKKRDARSSQGSNATVSPHSNNVNGKQSAQTQSPQHHHQLQKTESRTKEMDILIPVVNGKSSAAVSAIQLSPQSSVIKKSSDHSINSIINSSPSPPIHSTSTTSKTAATPSTSASTASVLVETKPRVIDLEKLSSPNDLLKVSQKDIGRNIPKYSKPIQTSPSPMDVSVEKIHRISSGSDSDCAIIDSPIKSTSSSTTSNIKPQFSQHLNNNKNNHSPVIQQQAAGGGGEIKKTKKSDSDYSSLIKNIASLTNPKTNSSQSFLNSPTMGDQRKMDTHGINGTANEHFLDPPSKSTNKGYNNNLHYSINELIVNTNRVGNHEVMKGNLKSSEYSNNPNNIASHVHNNISVITSTNDAVNSNFSVSPILNLSNKK